MNCAKDARKLANFITDLGGEFTVFEKNNNLCYNHIGALYTDIILQSSLNYKTVVKPRVERVLSLYPNANTVNRFGKLITSEGLENIIVWKSSTKLNRIKSVLIFSQKNRINTCTDLRYYLAFPENQLKFLELNGIGPKTLDYLLKLLDFDTVAVDRHIYSFVEMAELKINDYYSTKRVVEYAADFLRISRSSLDYSIWHFMSTKTFIKKSQLELKLV
ncbi:hypothetical protein [Chitinophaga sp. OAE865]|uniref:hypothetical protein n=1 Tax=Chitinophaga sp. OAE865 TaxID=2817898 RepID=UPI001AEB1776